jgi:hypothetical protein
MSDKLPVQQIAINQFCVFTLDPGATSVCGHSQVPFRVIGAR